MNVTEGAPVAEAPGRRTGATWVAATGAFLLLAAAAVFVATRWAQIPDAVKLALLVGLTGAAIMSGDRLRMKLPATGNALFHLGALLIPVDGAALGYNMQLSWQQILFFDGLLAAGALTLLAWRSKSPVLAAGASAGVVMTAAGVGALTAVPAALALAIFAGAATWYRPTERHAWVWAQIVAVAPIAMLAPQEQFLGRGVTDDLGLLAVSPWYLSVGTGVIAAAVIARAARLRNQPALAIVGLVALVAHGIAGWNATDTTEVMEILAFPALFVVVEIALLLAQRDAFWKAPAKFVGTVVEFIAAYPTIVAAPVGIAVLGLDADPDHVIALACALAGLGWMVSAVRRQLRAELPLLAAAIWGLTAVSVATVDPVAVATTALGAAVVALAALRERASMVVVGLAVYGTLAGLADERIALAVGATATLVIGAALTLRRIPTHDRIIGLVAALGTLGLGVIRGGDTAGDVVTALMWIGVCWLLALAADANREPLQERLGDIARIAAYLAFLPMIAWDAEMVLAPAVALLVITLAEGVLMRRHLLVNVAVLPLLIVQVTLADVAGLTVAQGGLTLCVAATVWLGLAALVQAPWHQPLTVAALASGALGVLGAAASPLTLGPAILIVGLLLLGQGLLLMQPELGHSGAVVAIIGAWVTFAAHEVLASEAYALPVALYLLVVGYAARRDTDHPMNSWIAYGPAIALMVGAAMSERIAGGPAWHSLVAGAIGVVAVIAGGSRRLAAPLLLGTGALVAVVVRESFDHAAGIPTWAWLAAGGTTLIAAAVLMERNDVGPIEAGKRVVDVVAAHFE